MKVSVTLSILLAFIGGKSCSEASESNGTNPTAKFYERIQSFPIILYQCFRNGTVLETGHAIITSALWDGTSGNTDCAQATIWEIQNGTAGSSKKSTFQTCYNPESRMVFVKVNETFYETFTILQEPYKEMAYFVKFGIPLQENVTSSAYKIYDRVETCTNADEFLPIVCPEGCGMVSTKSKILPQVF
ncbi:uncharacterized protein ISCGN_004594 [Ixodes scapularis]